MRVLVAGHYYFPFIGGVETQMRLIGHELARRGHQIQFAATRFGASKVKPRLRTLDNSLLAPHFADYRDEGIPVHAITPGPVERLKMLPIAVRAIPKLQRYAYAQLFRFGFPWFNLAYGARLREIVKSVDVVHFHGFDYLAWALQRAAEQQGKPFICTPYVHPHQWGDDSASLALYQKCAAVIGLLSTDCNYLIKCGVPRERVHEIGVIPNMTATPDVEAFRTKYQLHGKPVVLYVGRMVEHKGAKAVLSAAALVWEKVPDARFIFIGPPQGDSDRWFDNADPRILHLGRVSDQDRVSALAACSLFAMPSTSEILPTVYLEAWSLGRPVLAGPAHGMDDLVEKNGAGFVVQQDPAEIAARIEQILGNPVLSEQLGQAGLGLVQRQYSLDPIVSRLEQLYATEMAKKSA